MGESIEIQIERRQGVTLWPARYIRLRTYQSGFLQTEERSRQREVSQRFALECRQELQHSGYTAA